MGGFVQLTACDLNFRSIGHGNSSSTKNKMSNAKARVKAILISLSILIRSLCKFLNGLIDCIDSKSLGRGLVFLFRRIAGINKYTTYFYVGLLFLQLFNYKHSNYCTFKQNTGRSNELAKRDKPPHPVCDGLFSLFRYLFN